MAQTDFSNRRLTGPLHKIRNMPGEWPTADGDLAELEARREQAQRWLRRLAGVQRYPLDVAPWGFTRWVLRDEFWEALRHVPAEIAAAATDLGSVSDSDYEERLVTQVHDDRELEHFLSAASLDQLEEVVERYRPRFNAAGTSPAAQVRAERGERALSRLKALMVRMVLEDPERKTFTREAIAAAAGVQPTSVSEWFTGTGLKLVTARAYLLQDVYDQAEIERRRQVG